MAKNERDLFQDISSAFITIKKYSDRPNANIKFLQQVKNLYTNNLLVLENDIRKLGGVDAKEYLSFDELQMLIPMGRTSIYNWVKEGKFPKPVYANVFSRNRKYWKRQEVIDWIEKETEQLNKANQNENTR